MAKIADLLRTGRTFSFEFFPPKDDAEHDRLVRTLIQLQPLDPSFVSVTYRGGPSSRQRTHDLVASMLKVTTLNPMAHLICVGHARLELAEILVDLRKAGVDNLMALGGDPPTDPGATAGELRYANELVELARAIGGFSIGVAAHPAGHPKSPDRGADRDRLGAKLRIADFAVTQFFFDVEEFTTLVDDLGSRGLDKPIIPGIMPVTSLTSLERMTAMGGVVPAWLRARLEGAADPQSVRAAGIEAATELCGRLLDAGAPGLHFYTLNSSRATAEIYANLGIAASASSAGEAS
ncbi:MAG: methylenetetrahydrofolate reductase [Actinomycetota bacterium]|nr:methylenetetrahydrofolate reductase [Actinomycetota bacterium]